MNRRSILHWIWRLCTLGLVIALTYATTFKMIPYLDKKLSIFPAILVMYIGIAYLFLPAILRFWRIVMKPDHIPRYVTTPDGWPADPINIAIIANSKRHLVRSMEKAGWYTADPATFSNTIRQGYAILFNKPYLTAPFSAFYLFGRKFDVGFQIPYGKNKSPRRRHHVRFWQLIDTPTVDTHGHFAYWSARIKQLFGRKKTIWIGAAIDDIYPIGFRWRNLKLTHANGADHTKDRDLIIETLEQYSLVKSVEEIRDGAPFTMRSQNIGTDFIVDGYIKLVDLRGPVVSKLKKPLS